LQEKFILDGRYSVTDDGCVYSYVGKKYRYELSQANTSKYKMVCLSPSRKSKNFYVHRLIAEAFIPNPNEYPEVNHIDGNPSNNRINNLEWCTAKQNTIHAYSTGLIPSGSCFLCGENRFNLKHSICAKCRIKLISELEVEATRLNKSNRAISAIAESDIVKPSKHFEFLALRTQGLTYEEIAKIKGCSRQNVHSAISQYMKNAISENC